MNFNCLLSLRTLQMALTAISNPWLHNYTFFDLFHIYRSKSREYILKCLLENVLLAFLASDQINAKIRVL